MVDFLRFRHSLVHACCRRALVLTLMLGFLVWLPGPAFCSQEALGDPGPAFPPPTGQTISGPDLQPEHSPLSLPAPGQSPAFAAIDFFQGGYGELIIRLEAEQNFHWRLMSHTPGRLHYIFPETSVPSGMAKVYQLHEFSHPVKTALLRNTSKGSELIVTATGQVLVIPESEPGKLNLRLGTVAAKPSVAQRAPAGTVARPRDEVRPGLQPEDSSSDTLAPQAVFPGMRTNYTGTPISIDLQNIEVEHVLRLISDVEGYNLILDQEVSGRISMKLENVPSDQVLDLVLIQKGLGKVQIGNILRISTIQRLGSESRLISDARQEAARAREMEQELEPMQTAFIQVNYSKAEEMDARARAFLSRERGSMSHDPRTNTLIVTDIPVNIRKIRGVVERLDRPERQVLIEARIVYATDSFQRNMGIRWGGVVADIVTDGYSLNLDYLVNVPSTGVQTFGAGALFSKMVGSTMFALDAQLQLGEIKGETKVISSPRIVTLNNSKAEIEQGMSIPYTVQTLDGPRTEWRDAVLKLEVTPQITSDDTLILDLFVSDDSPRGEMIEKKHARTKLLVENEQILVLGGILKTIEERREHRVPGAADVPLLGWLFKSHANIEENRELLIFIRPTIL